MVSVELNADEKASLREISKTMMQKRIPEEHRSKLIELELIEQKLGGLALTAKGRMLLLRK